MSRFTPRAPADLKLLRAGICPECGASVAAGMAACRACRVDFGEHAALVAPPARPLSAEDIDELERGVSAQNRYPRTAAPTHDDELMALALGAALTGLLVVMADAALVDDPLVLMGWPAPPTHLARAVRNEGMTAACLADDPARFPPAPAPRISAALAPTSPDLDPDATLVHDLHAIAAVAATIDAHGRAQRLDD